MQALTRRHGPSPQAFVIVPIIGASLSTWSTCRCWPSTCGRSLSLAD